MEDLDAWMKKYINKHRIMFINNLQPDLFAQGFPGLSEHSRCKITNLYRQDSYVVANGELLACIMRIDNFPHLFTTFCQISDCTPKLAHIMKTGIMEYNRLLEDLQSSQAAAVRQNGGTRQINEHQQVSFHPTFHASKKYQGSRGNEVASVLFPEHPTNCVSNQSVISDTAKNVNDGIYSTAVDRTVDHKKGCDKYLLQQLENMAIVCEAQKSEGIDESSQNMNVENNNCANEGVVENECIGTDLVFRNGESNQGLSNDVQQIPCPCPYHATVSREEKNPPRNENERQLTNSVSDMQNIQRNGNVTHNDGLATENTLPVCNSSNMDRNDPIKMTYDVRKMMINGENITTHKKNKAFVISNKQNDKNGSTDKEKNDKVITCAEKCESNEDFSETAERKNKPLFQIQNLGQNTRNINFDSQSYAETFGSYYLTSSDEEELLPAQNHIHRATQAHFEIENLKLSTNKSGCLEESVQESDEDTFDCPQDTIPKEIQCPKPTVASEGNFIMLGTGLSGTQCEEDIEKYKYRSNSEKKEYGLLIDQSSMPTGPTLRVSSFSVNLFNDSSLEIENKNTSDNNGKPINITAVEHVTEDEESIKSYGSQSTTEFSLVTECFDVHSNPRKDKKIDSYPHGDNENELSLDDGSDSTASFVSSEIHHERFSITEVKNAECNIPSDKQNEKNTSGKENITNAETQISTVDQTIAEDNLVPINTTSDHNVELSQERALPNDVISINHSDAISVNETIPNTKFYIFENMYTPMKNLLHSFFPELCIRL